MEKIKVVYVISLINKALGFEWLAAGIDKNIFEPVFILMNPGGSELENFLAEKKIKVIRIPYRKRSDLIRCTFSVYAALKKEKPAMVHCHLFEASLAGLTAAWMAGIKRRIYTRHHSTYHHVYNNSAVKYDRWCNALASHIVATSAIVKQVLTGKENVHENKIKIIHHGFLLDSFSQVSKERKEKLAAKYNPGKKSPVIGAISRYTEWKGIQYIIPAFKKLLEKFPSAYLVLANARGEYAGEIRKLLSALPEKSYIEIDFEKDLFALYALFDVFVHVPVDEHSEAYGQVYVEALAAGIPSVFTLSGIACEFIRHRENALVVDYRNAEQVCESLIVLLEDKSLRGQLKLRGQQDVYSMFTIEEMIRKHQELYLPLT